MRARILVVDDERTAREELCEALRDAGYKVRSADSAETALEQVSQRSYDLCISDIRMPGMDGVELLRRLGEIAPETLVILVTVPLSKNGIFAGCFLVFIPALGEFVIPALLGGSQTLMIGKV